MPTPMPIAEPTALALDVRGLRKSFGSTVVLDGIDLSLPAGRVLALLGPNGAGKTTTVEILATLQHPDAGQVRIAGHDLRTEPGAIRAAIGVTGQFSAVDELLTGTENLDLIARLRHLPRAAARQRAADLLAALELTEAAGSVVSTFSGGMKRKLDLAMTLLSRPRVVFLDEPTTGLDPRSRQALWQLVADLAAEGVSVLLTTQYLDEADRLADDIALLDGGRIIAAGSPSELKKLLPQGDIVISVADAESLAEAVALLPGVRPDPHTLTLHVDGAGEVARLREVLDRLRDLDLRDVQLRTPDLQDVFLALTGTSPHPVQPETSH